MYAQLIAYSWLFQFVASVPSPLDPPEYMFRIRLICMLLETSGCYFNAGLSKKKLDCFLTYFQVGFTTICIYSTFLLNARSLKQRYFWFKKSSALWTDELPFPKDIDNMVSDIFQSLRPKMVQYKSWEEANKAASDLDEEYKAKVGE